MRISDWSSDVCSSDLLPDGWFTVLDATTQTKHWVRVKAYYPAQHSVLLGHYMEARFLKLRTGVFATEMGAGRIAASAPAPELPNDLARLVALPITPGPARSAERRAGKTGVRTGRSR